MLPLPFVDTAARVIFYAAFAVFVAAEAHSLVRGRSGRSTPADRGTRLAVVSCSGGGFFGGFMAAGAAQGAAIRPARWPVFVAGIVLMLAGTAVRQRAISTPGRNSSTQLRIAGGKRVVTGGPYGLVRHPSYTGSLVTLSGVGAALGNWLALVVLTVLPVLGFVLRIRIEDRLLRAALGEPYAAYAATHEHLAPGLW